MKKVFSQKVAYWLGVAVIGIALGLCIQFGQAWTEPTSEPPGGNLGAPINTGSEAQIKSGQLGVQGLLKGYVGASFFDDHTDALGNYDNPHIVSGVKWPEDGKDAANKDYVDANSGEGRIKIIKGSQSGSPTIDCGSGWKISKCGCGNGNTLSGAENNSVASYGGFTSLTGGYYCTFGSYGSQTGACSMGAQSYYAYIALCYQ